MWSKFEYLYMTKSLAHQQFLKQQLYSFKMVELKAIMEQLIDFNKIIGDLENIEVHLEDAGALVAIMEQLIEFNKIIGDLENIEVRMFGG